MENVLVIENLVKRYGAVEAVRGVRFAVGRGEVFGLLGPNGAGKTSTLECVVGLRRPDGGAIRVAGIDALVQPALAREKIGVQLQATALQDKITPRQALRLFAAFYARAADVEALLARFELREKADAAFDTLSGGQRQRLAIALALVHEPEVVFLDEPTAGLDPAARRELHGVIGALRSAGRTIFLTTHYIEEAQKLCDRVAIMDRGRIVASGRPADLIAGSKALPRVVVRTARPLTESGVLAITGVTRGEFVAARWELTVTSVTAAIQGIVRLVEAENNELLDVQIHQPTLEDVFVELTGTALAD